MSDWRKNYAAFGPNATMVGMKTDESPNGNTMRGMNKLVLISLFAIILTGCTFLKTPEIKGVVVDAETGKPIAGARVYASWNRIIAGPGGTTEGAILKELRMQTKADGSFEVPGYLLVNIVPFPFGQGGNFGFIVYDHGYEVKRFNFREQVNFRTPKYDEFKMGFQQTKIAMSKITDPEKYNSQITVRFGDEYLIGEYQYFLEHFPESRWRQDVQIQLNSMKKP